MKKVAKSTLLCCGAFVILFILFNIIAFVVPTEKSATFWTAYAFTTVAFIVVAVMFISGFNGKINLKSKFHNISVIIIALICLAVSFISFVIFKIFPDVRPWIAVIVYALTFCAGAINIIGAMVAKNEVERVDEKIDGKVFYLRSLQTDLELLAQRETDGEIKAEIEKLAQKVRYSDSISHESLSELENQLVNKVEELKNAQDKLFVIKEFDLLLTERNKKIKILK